METMLGEYLGIRLGARLGLLGTALMGAAGDGVVWCRIDRRNGGEPQAKWLQGFVRVDNGWHRIGLVVVCVATVRAFCCFVCCWGRRIG